MPWELLHPLSSEDALRALKKMKHHAPGLDSRKLSDEKGIPAEEWPGHFNLWLLAGYQLRRGETVLLLKYDEAGDPPKYRHIKMSDIVVRCFPQILAQQMVSRESVSRW